jgi:hypothetical protein
MSSVTNDQLRRLLLKQLTPDEIERLEEATLREDGVAERLLEAEFDLIDDYVLGRLRSVDCADVEKNFLITPERRVTLEVARALAAQRRLNAAALGSRKPARNWWPNHRRTLATLFAAGLAAVAFIPQWRVHLREPGAAFPAATAPTAPMTSPMQAAGTLPTVTLLADAVRGGSRPVVHPRLGTTAIRLQAEVPGPAKNAYSIELLSATGTRLFFASHLAIRVAGPYRFVEVTVPAEAIGPGARTVTLRVDGSSEQDSPEYRWQIEAENDKQKK